MIITIISIFIFTSLVWGFNKISPIKICPICAGVFTTWLWMLLGMGYGLLSVEKYQLIIAILMGGSVIGIVNKLEEKWKVFSKSRRKKSENENNRENKGPKDQLKDCC